MGWGRSRCGESALEASARLGLNHLSAALRGSCDRPGGATVDVPQGKGFAARTSLRATGQNILDVSSDLRPPCHRIAHPRIFHAALEPYRVTAALQCLARR